MIIENITVTPQTVNINDKFKISVSLATHALLHHKTHAELKAYKHSELKTTWRNKQ